MKKVKTLSQIIGAMQMTKLVSDQAKKNGFKEGIKTTIELFITILKSQRSDNMYTIALLLYAYVILGFIEKKVKK